MAPCHLETSAATYCAAFPRGCAFWKGGTLKRRDHLASFQGAWSQERPVHDEPSAAWGGAAGHPHLMLPLTARHPGLCPFQTGKCWCARPQTFVCLVLQIFSLLCFFNKLFYFTNLFSSFAIPSIVFMLNVFSYPEFDKLHRFLKTLAWEFVFLLE